MQNAAENRRQRSNGLIYFVAVPKRLPKHLKLEGIRACKRFFWPPFHAHSAVEIPA